MSSTDTDAPATPAQLNYARPSTLDKTLMLRVLKAWFRDDAQHSAKWRGEAKDDFDFLAGRQWSPEEESQLNEQLRPKIVFNRALTIVKAVAGFEINSRHEIQFLPRTVDDTAVNEVLTGASKWMGDECEAEDEESEAFQDCATVGMGWTESRISYDEDSSGLYQEGEINPLEMYWDYSARKRNLVDARRVARLRVLPLCDAQQMFEGNADDELDAKWAAGNDPDEQTKTLEQKRVRDENTDGNVTERAEVHLVQMQWFERVPYWLVADPQTNKKIELPENQFTVLKKRMEAFGMKLTAVKIYKRQFYQAFIGGKVLECGPAPIPERFTFRAITGEADKNRGTWFGLIRMMRDPQKWANKWLSQTLHIMNTNAKGGIMAELDAFDDQRQAEESYARPEAITWMKKGALSSPNGAKWALKPQASFPAGFFNLLEFAISSLRDVTGINLELLGQKDVNQAGVLEAQRKQAGMTVLATMFDSLRRFRKEIGRIRLYYIQNFLSDGRLMRVTGEDGKKVIPLVRDKCLGQYDVVIDDAPTSPNQKQANWAIIMPMIPVFREQLMNNPELLLEILQFSPLPGRLVEAIRTVMMKQGPQQQEAQQMKMLQLAKLTAEISRDQSTAEYNNAKAGSTQATAMYDIAMARNLLTKNGMDGLANHLEAAAKLAEIDHTRAQTQKTMADTHGARMDAAHTGISALIDALTPIQQPAPQAPVQQPMAA